MENKKTELKELIEKIISNCSYPWKISGTICGNGISLKTYGAQLNSIAKTEIGKAGFSKCRRNGSFNKDTEINTICQFYVTSHSKLLVEKYGFLKNGIIGLD